MPNLGTDKSARTVHIEKNNSKCISNLYIAMTHLRINRFSEPPVCITLLVSPPLICADSVRFDVVSTENVRITSVTVYGKNGTIDQFHEYANGVSRAYITNTILIFIVRSIISHYALIQGYCFG